MGEQFDIIFTSACFEHFAMPWLAAVEMAKMLKVGGTLFVETHFSFSAHERPWNFFQYSDMGLRVLFANALGFECIEAGMSNPIVGRFSKYAVERLRYRRVPGLYCHSEYLGKRFARFLSLIGSRLTSRKSSQERPIRRPGNKHFNVPKWNRHKYRNAGTVKTAFISAQT